MTPFAAINDTAGRVTVVLDAAMMEHATLNYHPLVNTMTTSIARDDLVRFLAATGHRAAHRARCPGSPPEPADARDCIRRRIDPFKSRGTGT